MSQNNETTYFNKLIDFMEQNTKGAQIGCYSVALVGLTIALRKVRPFSKFKKPSDIPTHFIRERRELLGTVQRVEPNGVLLINHKPLVPIPGMKKGELPTKIANVDINTHGVSWLQILVVGNNVKFIPISKTEKYIECQIKLPQQTHAKKSKDTDLGVSLLSIGFGSLVESPTNKKDKNYKYYTQLVAAKESALKKKMGLKYYIKPTKVVLSSTLHQLSIFINFLINRITKKTTIPKVVAA